MVELAGFSCEKKIAKGGMAEVYQGIQLSLQRPVAIKFLSDSFINHPEARQLFEQESLIIAQLSHPNIVQVIDRGIIDERPYFVMEFINGSDLNSFIETAEPSINVILEIMMGICKGVAYAHQNGIIHRDLKPSNILLGQDNIPKILDFGIALLYSGSGNSQSTSVVGSRNYMSPEQLRSPANVDHLTDVFALGVIMYQVFTGQLPTQGALTAPVKLNSNIPLELSKLILLCLSPDKNKRPQSVDVLRDNLLRCTRGSHLSKVMSDQGKQLAHNLQKKFQLLDVIKESKFSSLFLFQDSNTQQMITMKKLNSDCKGLKEAARLSKLEHPNIAQILGTSDNKKIFIIVSEYLSGGPLTNHLHRPFHEQEFLEIALELCEAMIFAHNQQILHSNLHPNNILFDQKGTVKIADFGIKTADHNHSKTHQDYRGYSQQAPSKQRDIFAMGAIFHHMLLSKPPKIVRNRWQRSKAIGRLKDELQNLLKKMLTDDLQRRYQTFETVKQDLLSFSREDVESASSMETLEKQVKTYFRLKKKNRQQKKPRTVFRYLLLFTILATVIELAIFFPETLQAYLLAIGDFIMDLITKMRHMRG